VTSDRYRHQKIPNNLCSPTLNHESAEIDDTCSLADLSCSCRAGISIFSAQTNEQAQC